MGSGTGWTRGPEAGREHERAARFAAGALLLLAVLLPFELRAPLVRVLGIGITDLEAVLYTALAAAVWTAVARNARFDALDWTLQVLAFGWLAAALAAPWNHALALKHAARLIVGIELAVFARSALAGADRARLGRTLAWTGGAAALLGLAELAAPDALEPWLAWWKARPTTSQFGLRASGTFEHANQLAGFLDVTAPFTLLLVADPVRRAFGLALLAVTAVASLATLSRAGWVASAAGVAVAAVAGRFLRMSGRTAAAAVLAAAAAGAAFLGVPSLRSRLLWPLLRPPFAARYAFVAGPPPRIVVENTGTITWEAMGPRRTTLAVDGRRLSPPPPKEKEVYLALPSDVPPGHRVSVPIDPAHSLPPGRYLHVYDLVHPAYGYSSRWENVPVSGETIVRSGGRAELDYRVSATHLRPETASRLQLWHAAWLTFADRPWLGIGPGVFQHSYPGWLPFVRPDDRLHPNELYLHVLAEGGLVTALAGLAAALAAAAILRRRLALPAPDPVSAAGAGALVAWGLHGLFDSFILFNGCAVACWLALAVACPKSAPGPQEGGPPS